MNRLRKNINVLTLIPDLGNANVGNNTGFFCGIPRGMSFFDLSLFRKVEEERPRPFFHKQPNSEGAGVSG